MAPIQSIDIANQTLLRETIQYYLDSTDVREQKCHLARFMAHLGRGWTETIYWSTAGLTMILVIIVAQTYSRTQEDYSDSIKEEEAYRKEKGEMTPEDRKKWNEKHTSIARRCLFKAFICFAVTCVAITMQAFSIISLLGCHKEPLLGFYWPIWTMLGAGSCIAMLGVMISQTSRLRGHELPVYPVALGTPVLVAGASGDFAKKEFDKWRRKRKNKNKRKNDAIGKGDRLLNSNSLTNGNSASSTGSAQSHAHAVRRSHGEAGVSGEGRAQGEPEFQAVDQSQAESRTAANSSETL